MHMAMDTCRRLQAQHQACQQPTRRDCEFATVHLNTGETTAFETDLFRGSVAMWASGLKSSPKELFGSRKRKSWVIIQVLISAVYFEKYIYHHLDVAGVLNE